MIKGIGIDIVDKDRIARALDRHGEQFLNRIFTEQEKASIPTNGMRRIEYISGRFAAKEAFAKAAGFGIGRHLSWHDVEILREDTGRPVIRPAAQWLEKSYPGESIYVHVSLTHEKKYAAAQVVIEG